uniref:Phospholipase A2 n=1 Tax=Latimeria chalumnae TaxID=7897 RepID=H3BHG1_LATCH
MKLLTCLATIYVLAVAMVHGNMFQYGSMIYVTTRRNILTDYNSYGCYCGTSGRGQPIDATDRCCQKHDCCYERLIAQGCKPKTETYKFHLKQGGISCIASTRKRCEKLICCDLAAALCFRRASKSYKKSNHYYSSSKCTGTKPQC